MTPIILLILGLSMGIFSTSMLLNVENCFSEKENFRSVMILGLMQGFMLLLGYGLGSWMKPLLLDNLKIYAVLIMILVGVKMIFESFRIRHKFRAFQLNSILDLVLLSLGKGFHALFIGLALTITYHPIANISGMLIGFSILFSLLGIQAGKKWGRFSLANLSELLGGILILISSVLFMLQ